jgi:hypothetical protein
MLAVDPDQVAAAGRVPPGRDLQSQASGAMENETGIG